MANTPEDKQQWREKYLDALDTQELLEQRHQAQVELLRRVLVRVSLAAEGQDEALDQLMVQLRERLRKDKAADIGDLLGRLEASAIALEQQRDHISLSVRESLAQVLKPWQGAALSRSLKWDISDYLAQLPKRSKKIRLYPALLQQLADLQQQAFSQIEQPKTGLLQRLIGAKNTASADDAAGVLLPLENSHLPESPITAAQSDATELWFGKLLALINEFLESLEQDDQWREPVQQLRQELSASDSIEAALGSLRQVRSLVMEAYLSANRAFADYLDRVNRELAEISTLLGGAVQSSYAGQEASAQLQAQVMQEMTSLEQQAEEATDLVQLKQRVQSQLGSIRQALDRFQQTEQAQQQLAVQLNSLGEKIKVMEAEAEQNRTTLEQQRFKALHDALTELPNREAYNERARAEVQRWERYGRPLTIAIMDIDHFKKINDNYGHQAGDRVIKVIGRSIAKRLREVDFFCRYGGEEFVALMPETSGDNAMIVLEKIREAIARAAFNYKEQPLQITISAGLTEFKPGDTLDSAFERADQALYAAKSSGRNTTQLA